MKVLCEDFLQPHDAAEHSSLRQRFDGNFVVLKVVFSDLCMLFTLTAPISTSDAKLVVLYINLVHGAGRTFRHFCGGVDLGQIEFPRHVTVKGND